MLVGRCVCTHILTQLRHGSKKDSALALKREELTKYLPFCPKCPRVCPTQSQNIKNSENTNKSSFTPALSSQTLSSRQKQTIHHLIHTGTSICSILA